MLHRAVNGIERSNSWARFAKPWVRGLLSWITGVALGLLALHGADAQATPLTAPMQSGLNWLNAQVNADGSIVAENRAMAVAGQTRAETARTLQALGAPVPPALLAALQPADRDPVEILARKALALADAGQDAAMALERLKGLQNPDGGYGAQAGYASNPIDTAFAAQAMATSGAAYQASAAAALGWISTQSNSPGAFGIHGEDAVYASAQVAIAANAWSTRLNTAAIAQPIATWLSTQRDPGTQTVFQNAHALIALVGMTASPSAIKALHDAITQAQGPDGSWGQDPYVTAIALRALYAADQPPPAATRGDLRGLIIDGATRQPLSGATAQLKEASAFTSGSDASGAFQLSAIPQGNYTLRTARLGYLAQEIPVAIAAGKRLDVGTVALSPATYTATLSGVVKNAYGTALAGVIVSVGTSAATTNAQGAYTLADLAPGTGVVRAQLSGYQTATVTLEFQAGQSYVFSPTLLSNGVAPPTTATLKGSVIDAATKAPLAFAQVSLEGGATVSPNAAGAFELTGLPPGAFKLSVSAAGYQGILISGMTVAGANDLGTLGLTPQPTGQTASLSGVVRDTRGQALSGTVVEVVGSGRKASTDAQGAYGIDHLSPGTVTITATKAGYQTASATTTFEAGKSYIFSPTLVLNGGSAPTDATVRGSVRGADTQATLAGATISIRANGNPPVTARSDAAGQFSAAGLPAGNFTIAVAATGYQVFNASGSLALGINDTGAIVLQRAPAASTVTGLVLDGLTQTPIAGAQVAVQGSTLAAATDSAGRYVLAGIVGPQVTLTATAPGYLPQQTALSVPAGADATQDIVLYPPAASGISIIGATTDKATYAPKDTVQLNTQILNSSANAASLVIRVLMRDASGQVVREVKANPIGLGSNPPNMPIVFESGKTTAREVAWSIDRQAAGKYAALLQAMDGAGRVVAEKSVSFAVASASILTGGVSVTPPLAQVGTQQPIVLEADVTNSGNADLPAGTMDVKVIMESPDTSVSLTPQISARPPICYAPLLKSPAGLVARPAGGQYSLDPDGSVYALDGTGTATLLAKVPNCRSGVMAPTVDAGGSVLVACGTTVHQISPAGGVTPIATIAGPLTSIQAIERGAGGEIYAAGLGTRGSALVRLQSGQQTVLLQNGLAGPTAMVKTSAGDYVATNNADGTLVRIDPKTGAITPFASGLNRPTGITQDSAGHFFVANTGDNTIVRVLPDGTSSVFATGLNQPYDLKFDPAGSTLYVTNAGNNTISAIDSQGHVQTLARSIANRPQGMRYDTAGNLWIANDDGTLRVSHPDGSVETLATGLASPRGLAVDGAGTAYVASYSSGTVQKISGGQTTPFATGLSSPWGVAIDDAGTIWVSEYGAHRIKGFDASGKLMATIDSLLQSPRQVRVGPNDEIYVLNGAGFVTVQGAGKPRILWRDPNVVLTDIVVDPGSGQLLGKSNTNKLYRIDPGTGAATQFATLPSGKSWYGLAADMAGNAYSIDYYGRVLNKISPAGDVTAFSGQFPNYSQYLKSALDGKPIVFYDATHYYQFAADGSVIANVFSVPGNAYVYGTTLAGDGSLLAQTYGKTYRLNAATGAVLQTYDASTYGYADWTAQSSGTLYGLHQGQEQLLKAAPGASTFSVVLSGLTSPQDMAWSGTELRFTGGNSHLYRFTPGGAYPERHAGSQSHSGYLDAVGADTFYGSGSVLYKFSSGSQSTLASGLGSYANSGVAAAAGRVAAASNSDSTITVFDGTGALVQRNAGLDSPQGLVFDTKGRLWVASRNNSLLARVNLATGAAQPVAGMSQPDFLALAENGDIYASGGTAISKVSPDDRASAVASGVQVSGLTMYPRGLLWDSGTLVAADSANAAVLASPTPANAASWAVRAAGLSKPSAMVRAPDGALYIGSQNNHTILRYAAGQLQPYAGGFGFVNTLAFEPNGNLLVGQNSGVLSRVEAGTRAVTDVGIAHLLNQGNVTGLSVLGNDHFLALTASNACVADISVRRPMAPPAAGTVIHQARVPMPDLATDGGYTRLSLGQWLPEAGGDYRIEASRPGYDNVLTNFVHVGPAASSTLQAMKTTLSPADTQLPMCMKLSGADFTTISRPELGLMKPVASSPRPSGMTADKAGNIYTTDNGNLYQTTPSGIRSTLATGQSFRFGLTIDNQGFLYAPARNATGSYDLVRFDSQGQRTVVASLGVSSANGVQVDSQGNILVGSPGKLLKVTPQGQVSVVTTSGLPDPRGIAIDGKDNVYVQNENHVVTMIRPDGSSSQVFWKANGTDHPVFEGDGYPNIAADCADNFYIAPYAWEKIKQNTEEHSIAQVIPRTGQVALLVDVTKVDPSLTDIDYLAYDRLNTRLLAWDDYSARIWQVPMTCGAISVDVHLLGKPGQTLSGATVPPAAQVPLPDGRTEYVWSLKDVPASGAQVCFDASQTGLQLGEQRKALDSAYISFKNSFAANDVKVPIDVPSVSVGNQIKLGIATDKPGYGPDETAVATTTLENTNPQAIVGLLTVEVLDAQGTQVALLLSQPASLAAGETLPVPGRFAIGRLLTGTYTARATLADAGGSTTIAQASTPFDVLAQPSVTSTLGLDRSVYNATDRVLVHSTVLDSSPNVVYEQLALRLRVTDPGGNLVFEKSLAIARLTPGSQIALDNVQPLLNALAGGYTVTQDLLDAQGAVLDTRTAAYTVQASAADGFGLTGLIHATPGIVAPGGTVTLASQITNGGNSTLADLPLTIYVIDPVQGAVVAQFSQTLASLAPGQTSALQDHAWVNANGSAGSTYLAVLVASVGAADHTLAQTSFTLGAADASQVTPIPALAPFALACLGLLLGLAALRAPAIHRRHKKH